MTKAELKEGETILGGELYPAWIKVAQEISSKDEDFNDLTVLEAIAAMVMNIAVNYEVPITRVLVAIEKITDNCRVHEVVDLDSVPTDETIH